jgi:hypothetical protein
VSRAGHEPRSVVLRRTLCAAPPQRHVRNYAAVSNEPA